MTAPQSDWGDSAPAGVPFDITPGGGVVSASDEYVEIQNIGTGATSLVGLQVRMTDGTPEVYTIGSTTGLPGAPVETYSPGASALFLPAGGVVAIGDMPGSMGNDVFVELLDSTGLLVIDDVELGGNTAPTNFEAVINAGDPVSDGAPAIGLNGASTGPGDESIRRVTPATFTGNDQTDFTSGVGTPSVP